MIALLAIAFALLVSACVPPPPPPPPPRPIADEFIGDAIAWGWTTYGGRADGTVSEGGGHLNLVVPGGALDHDLWDSGDHTVGVSQADPNNNFYVEAKFDRPPLQAFQDEGVLVRGDGNRFARFDAYSDGASLHVFAGTIDGTAPLARADVSIPGVASSLWMRVARRGDTWTQSYSTDGTHYTTTAQFDDVMTVNAVGPYAGNSPAPASGTSPAWTAQVDYFRNVTGDPSPPGTTSPTTTDPPIADQTPTTTTTATTTTTTAPATAPTVSVWYGDTQTFGQIGRPQTWVNVLGNASAPGGVATLSYTLNGGAPQPLWLGTGSPRLVAPGDFNVEIPFSSLNPGANTVVITATGTNGRSTTHPVTVNYSAGHTWPANYSVNWANAGGNIANVAQVVDGQWAIQGNTVRTLQTGYDRLLAIGDAATWKDYDVTSNVTIHSMDPTGGAVGIVVGWQGHTTNQYGLNLPDQPRTGHPFPAFFNFSGLNSGRLDLNIFSNNNSAADNERFLAVDNSGMTLTAGVTYTFKGEVTENSATSSHFKFKVWPVGTPEPAAWLLETDGAHSQGSILLGAHQADASFGTTAITALP